MAKDDGLSPTVEPASSLDSSATSIPSAVVGFTGTQRGMTTAQEETLLSALVGFREGGSLWMRNGDCVGSDERAGKLWATLGGKIHLHPPISETKRAFLKWDRCELRAPYLDRNRAIVNASNVLIATPGEAVEQLRGGTWYTVRRARGRGRPIMVIRPDGAFSLENWPAQAMSAREGQDRNGLEAKPASAVAESDAPDLPPSPSSKDRSDE